MKMTINSTDDFLLGLSNPIKPSSTFLNELLLNGTPPDWIDKFLATGICHENHGSLQAYVGAQGYVFDWGHVVESISTFEEDGEVHHCAGWGFCLDELLAIYHEKGLSLDDLSRSCFDLLTLENRRPNFHKQIPSFIMVVEGDEVSTFELMVFDAGEKGIEDIAQAREWIACYFLYTMLEDVIGVLKKAMRNR